MLSITPETRLSRILESIPESLDYILSLNPHDFERLRNPRMRKYMSPRITLARVAAMAHIPVETFIQTLAALGEDGKVAEGVHSDTTVLPQSPETAPSWMTDVRPGAIHWVNVLPIDDVLGDPIPPINTAVRRMAPGSILGIKHRWEPQPLYDIWQKMGIEWYSMLINDEEWHIFVHKPAGHRTPDPNESVMVDLRHLPPEEGPPRVAAMFEQLPVGHWVEVWAQEGALEPVKRLLNTRHPGQFLWNEEPAQPEKRVVRITVQDA